MSEKLNGQFKEQGGAATMDPSVLYRWLTSKMMTRMSSAKTQIAARKQAEKKRIKQDLPHTVEYFHQIDDGYSHLAVQLIEKFNQRYSVQLKCHLVSAAKGDNLPEPGLLSKLSCYDASWVASAYGLHAPEASSTVLPHVQEQALSILALLNNNDFVKRAAQISAMMWSNDEQGLTEFARQLSNNSEESNTKGDRAKSAIEEGNARRAYLKHYSGGMFYYAGEWYWGVDRFYHLELRLQELGLDSTPNEPLLAPRQTVESGPLKDDGQLTLEIYPSLRSPYTAIVFDRAVMLAQETGVRLIVRPVLPMVMRGVPATREKGQYILFDTGREARAAGVPFGPCADPIGDPTRRAYSLYSWAEQQGKAVEFFSAFLKCAWTEAINTNTNTGMQKVVERAGLDWNIAKTTIDKPSWQDVIEKNRQSMYQHGLWGVPSFRLMDEQGETVLALWGQDRLWTVAAAIQKLLKKR